MNHPDDQSKESGTNQTPPLHQGKLPRSTPQTDPTNPYRQEAVGEFVAAEHHTDETGLQESDLDKRRTRD